MEARAAADLPLYLRELKNDFRRLHEQARELVAQSGAESADLVAVLMKQQTTFWRATTALEFRLALEQMGIGKVDVAPFMQLIEAMRVDLAQRTASADGRLKILQQNFRFRETCKLAFRILEVASVHAAARAFVLGGIAQVQHLVKEHVFDG